MHQNIQKNPLRNRILEILNATDPDRIESIRQAAETETFNSCGREVYYRGLIEYSNFCCQDCYYCGIRKSNHNVERYELSYEQVIEIAHWCSKQRYGSLVLQSGERTDESFISGIVTLIRSIKKQTQTEEQPQGLGITLSIGEQTPETYTRFFEAGAHRYLLRIETSNPNLFAKIHPPSQSIYSRIECLRTLKEIGFQVGTGVMIGLPGQTIDDLADDILFFRDQDIDMIGMGPFIPHSMTPLGQEPCPDISTRLRLSLLMIAATRLTLKDVNIASTTALQTLDPFGREKGLRFGANVIMPQMTPVEVRRNYLLYPGKPCLDESAMACSSCLEARIRSTSRTIGYGEWGDSKHAIRCRSL